VFVQLQSERPEFIRDYVRHDDFRKNLDVLKDLKLCCGVHPSVHERTARNDAILIRCSTRGNGNLALASLSCALNRLVMKTTRTKKTTVITTEKREVWVVRKDHGATQEHREEPAAPDSSDRLAMEVLNEPPEGAQPDEANDHFKE
jgi:hypothetical protein